MMGMAPAHDEAPSIAVDDFTGDSPSGVSLKARMAMLDGDDLVVDLVEELITESLCVAKASYVQRHLMAYTARTIVDQLFAVVAACEPTLANHGAAVFCPIQLLPYNPLEEPPLCAIDATCRLEIRSRDPQPIPISPPTAHRKSKRLMIKASLAASSVLLNAAKLSPSSPRAVSVKMAPAASPSGPIPGIPFSTAPTQSPRKGIALLKMAMQLASAPPNRQALAEPPAIEESDLDEADRLADADSESIERIPRRDSRKDATLSPSVKTLGSSAWSITLSGDLSTRQDVDAVSTSVNVEFVLPQKLPIVGQRQTNGMTSPESRRASRDVHMHNARPRRGTFLQPTDEHDAVAFDPNGFLGYDIREHLALSPGVKLQGDGGELLKTGPQLPEMPSKMRRATFVEATLAVAALAVSPTRPPERPRPSTTSGIPANGSVRGENGLHNHSGNNSGVFSLTETTGNKSMLSDHHLNESVRSLDASTAGSTASSSSMTTSVKPTLFRKPSKITRPCRASVSTATATATATASASTCCGGHINSSTVPVETEAVTDLVKQRAFQRKPSVLHMSPPKTAPSRRSVVHSNPPKPSAPSPLARRSLLCTTSTSSKSQTQNDPLRRATKLL